MDYALIKNNIVVNKIVADDDFIKQISKEYDLCLPLKGGANPNLNDRYENGAFVRPKEIHDIPVDIDQVYLKSGSQTSFPPFKLSKESGGYDVSIDGKFITVGCMSYNVGFARDTLYQLLNNEKASIKMMTMTGDGIVHGNKFEVKTPDLQLILQALETLDLKRVL